MEELREEMRDGVFDGVDGRVEIDWWDCEEVGG